ncbi:MAG: response regulator [Candidatus Limnocylindria bacterium]
MVRARILIVEDEPQLRGLLRLYLERAGYVVADAGDGDTALAAFAADGADLVVLDLMLPGMQGEAVLQALRGIPEADLPHVFERFYRSDPSRTGRSGAGAGIGLTIARELLASSGGSITVEASGPGGTALRLAVPRA